MGKGSGSVTTFSHADGFVVDPAARGDRRRGRAGRRGPLLGRGPRRPTWSSIGSHCVGLDYLLGALAAARRHAASRIAVGSRAASTRRGAGSATSPGVHLLDPATGDLQPALPHARGSARARLRPHAGHRLPAGRRALRGQAAARGGPRGARGDPGVRDGQPQPRQRHARPRSTGCSAARGRRATRVEAASHNAVAAAVAQGRADWGIAIDMVARLRGLGFSAHRRGAVRLRDRRGPARAPCRRRLPRGARRSRDARGRSARGGSARERRRHGRGRRPRRRRPLRRPRAAAWAGPRRG